MAEDIKISTKVFLFHEERAGSIEMLTCIYQTTWRHISEDRNTEFINFNGFPEETKTTSLGQLKPETENETQFP
jgi:hypothetical protein